MGTRVNMKKLTLFLIFTIVLFSCSSTQSNTKNNWTTAHYNEIDQKASNIVRQIYNTNDPVELALIATGSNDPVFEFTNMFVSPQFLNGLTLSEQEVIKRLIVWHTIEIWKNQYPGYFYAMNPQKAQNVQRQMKLEINNIIL
jgi:hypothetical protein